MSELSCDIASSLAKLNFSNELVPAIGRGPCSQGEARLVEAFKDEAFVVVNGLMLVKGAGETIGIPLRREELPGGTTDTKAWYNIDYGKYGKTEWDKRAAIRAAFINGDTHVNLPGTTRWFRWRDVLVDQVCPGEDLTLKAQEAARKLTPQKPMPGDISRRDYLNRYLLFPEL